MKTLPVLTPTRTGHEPGRLHDLAQGAQHPLLVVARARRSARGQEGLDAALADVRFVERHLVAKRRLLDRPHPLVQGLGEGQRAQLLEEVVGVLEVDEGRGDGAVLRLGLAKEHVLAGGHGDAGRDVEALDLADIGGPATLDLGRGDEQDGLFLARADAGRVQHRGQPRTDPDLRRVGDALHRQGLGHVRAADQQLAMDAPGHEEVERAGRDPDRHPQDDGAAAHVEATDPGDLGLHLPGGAARPAFVVGTVEQEEERVAAPLEEAGPPVIGLVEQGREHAIERVAHQLGPDLALARESLAEGGEPRDVDEHHAARDFPMAGRGRVPQPVHREAWHVRTQEGGLLLGRDTAGTRPLRDGGDGGQGLGRRHGHVRRRPCCIIDPISPPRGDEPSAYTGFVVEPGCGSGEVRAAGAGSARRQPLAASIVARRAAISAR